MPYRGAILAATLAKGRELGFEAFEVGISHHAAPTWDELQRASQEVRFSSVHNYLFRPGSRRMDPRGDGLSSLSERTRQEAVRLTILSLEGAAALGARAVVIHAGNLDWRAAPELQMELMSRYEEEGPTDGLRTDAARLWDQRIGKARPYVDAAIRSLREVTAQGFDVALGLETRFGVHELPDPWELDRIFHEVGDPHLYYWHDVGHAQVQENLGWSRHEEWLDRFRHRLLGLHLHDVQGCRDHLPPGQGSVDYGRIRPFLKPDTLRVLELSSHSKAEDVAAGKAHLQRQGF